MKNRQAVSVAGRQVVWEGGEQGSDQVQWEAVAGFEAETWRDVTDVLKVILVLEGIGVGKSGCS